MRARGNSLLPTPRPLGLDNVDEISSDLDSQRRCLIMLKEACLARDGGKCIVTGAWQLGYSHAPPDGLIARTQAVHIIPFSLGNFTEDKVQNSKPSTILAIADYHQRGHLLPGLGMQFIECSLISGLELTFVRIILMTPGML